MNERRFVGEIAKLRNPERLERLQVNRVLDYSLAGLAGKGAVDVGTGTGVFAEALHARGLQVHGIDCNSDFVGIARQLVPGVEFSVAPAEKLPFFDQSCDLVFMGHLLHETDDAEAAMSEAFRVTRQRLAVLEWPYADQPVGPPLAHRIPPDRIRDMGLKAGFAFCDVIQLKVMQLVIFDR